MFRHAMNQLQTCAEQLAAVDEFFGELASRGERQFVLIDKRGQSRAQRRPLHDALPRRHEGETPLGFLAKQPEIGCGVPNAEHALTRSVATQRADASTDEAAGDNPQSLAVKITKVHHVDRHAAKLIMKRRSKTLKPRNA